jgi:hypothetical protein
VACFHEWEITVDAFPSGHAPGIHGRKRMHGRDFFAAKSLDAGVYDGFGEFCGMPRLSLALICMLQHPRTQLHPWMPRHPVDARINGPWRRFKDFHDFPNSRNISKHRIVFASDPPHARVTFHP